MSLDSDCRVAKRFAVHPHTHGASPNLFALQTGRSKHYAFIEFDSARVAEIVAETMDNYLLMGHILKCRVIPKSDVHPELWIGADKKFKKVPMARVYRVSHNKVRFSRNRPSPGLSSLGSWSS